jgi:hypothetical protein
MPRSKDFLTEVTRASYPSVAYNSCVEEYFEGEEIDKDDPSKSYRWMTTSDGSKELYSITTEELNGQTIKTYLPKNKKGWQPLTITQKTSNGEKIIYSRMTYVEMKDLLNDYLLTQSCTNEKLGDLVLVDNGDEISTPTEWIKKFVPKYDSNHS